MTDLTKDRKIATVSSLMEKLEEEIASIKDGGLKADTARLVMRARTLQMQGIGMYLQAARIEARLRPALRERMGEVIDVKPVEGT